MANEDEQLNDDAPCSESTELPEAPVADPEDLRRLSGGVTVASNVVLADLTRQLARNSARMHDALAKSGIQEVARLQNAALDDVRKSIIAGTAHFRRNQAEMLERIAAPMLEFNKQINAMIRSAMAPLAQTQLKAMAAFRSDVLASLAGTQLSLSMGLKGTQTVLLQAPLVSQSCLRMTASLADAFRAPALVGNLRLRAFAVRPPGELVQFADASLSGSESEEECLAAEAAVEHGTILIEDSIYRIGEPLSEMADGDAITTSVPASFPTFNILEVHHARIHMLLQSEGDSALSHERLNDLPETRAQRYSVALIDKVLNCNRLCERHDMATVFPATTSIVEAAAVLPNLIATNVTYLREYITHMYKLVYEGSGEASRLLWVEGEGGPERLTDEECQPVWDLKHLRNLGLVHDVQHGAQSSITKKHRQLADVLDRAIGLVVPTAAADYIRIQLFVLQSLGAMLDALLARLEQEAGEL